MTHLKILVLVGGKKTPSRVMICNKALVDWMAVMKFFVNRRQMSLVSTFYAKSAYKNFSMELQQVLKLVVQNL